MQVLENFLESHFHEILTRGKTSHLNVKFNLKLQNRKIWVLLKLKLLALFPISQKMKTINTPLAPQAIGPYSQAIATGNLIFCSGQIALQPNGEFLNGTVEEQAQQVLKNLQEVLKAANSDLSKVVKTTIFLASIEDFTAVNSVYADFFGESKPARATIEVSNLPKNAKVEIEAIATI